MDHPEEMAIVRYVNKRATEEEAEKLAQHVFRCKDCLEKVMALRRLCRQFDEIWDSWTAREHGRRLMRWRIAEALAKAAMEDEGILERAWSWLVSMEGDAGIAVRIIISREGALAVPIDVPPQLGYDMWHDFSEASGELEEVLRGRVREAHYLLATGRWDEAASLLRDTMLISKEAGIRCDLLFAYRGTIYTQIRVDGETKAIEVIWEEQTAEALPCLLLLLPEKENRNPLVAKPEWSPQSGNMVAVFRELEEGRYTLCIGPVVHKFQRAF
ncbi:hypothetical protein [Candidatus Solincola tengchongensis]|uniref:hypothetical protein n=1 Tax=Candidatus Solincola tengchongensis TaxID=2900693 RepID=UPI00257B5E89|nr:hypothetical protein [Candidatus Solincola tengchongensis]